MAGDQGRCLSGVLNREAGGEGGGQTVVRFPEVDPGQLLILLDPVVTVHPDHTFAVDMRLHQGLIDSTKNFGLNLGLAGVPFKVETSGSVNLKVGFDYELAFGFGGGSAFSVDTSKKLLGGRLE